MCILKMFTQVLFCLLIVSTDVLIAETAESARCKWLPPYNLTVGYNESLNLVLEVTTSTDCGQGDTPYIHLFTSASQDPIDFNLYTTKAGQSSAGDRNETCVQNHTFSIEMTPEVHKLLHGVIFAKNCRPIGILAIRYYIMDDSGHPCSVQTTQSISSTSNTSAVTLPQSSDVAPNNYNNCHATVYISRGNEMKTVSLPVTFSVLLIFCVLIL